jgi:hypothetical protein
MKQCRLIFFMLSLCLAGAVSAPLVAQTFVPVTNITDVPTIGTIGEDLLLTGTVVPNNATHQEIYWSTQNITAGLSSATVIEWTLVDGMLTPITKMVYTLNPSAPGTIIVTATIKDGTTSGIDYTQNFSIIVTAASAALTVSATSLSFAIAGGQEIFNITSNTTWTISSSETWFSVSPTSGSNNGTITVTVSPNTTTNQRTATIIVIGSDMTPHTISVTQAVAMQKPGDITGDGVINLFDMVAILDHLNGEVILSDDALFAADANQDGIVNIFDLVAILDHLNGTTLLW